MYPHFGIHWYATLHGKQVAHGDETYAFGCMWRYIQEFANGIIEGQESIFYAHTHGHGSKGFGNGVGGVAVFLAPGVGVHLGNPMAVPHDDA